MSYNTKTNEEMIRNMQKHLSLIRECCGLTQTELANIIGVTRQTLNNIENNKSPLSQTQYVAIACLLDIMIKHNPSLQAVIISVLNLEINKDLFAIAKESCGVALGAAVPSFLGLWIGNTISITSKAVQKCKSIK